MLKKYNVILVFSFAILTIKYHVGFAFVLPLLIFYLLKDFKNIYYSYIPSIIMTLVFNFDGIIPVVSMLAITLLFYFLIMFLSKKNSSLIKKPFILIVSYILLINALGYILFFKNEIDLIVFIFVSLVSVMLYLYFERFLYKLLKEPIPNLNMVQSSLSYLEIMIALIAFIGAAQINIFSINLGMILGIYFSMYFSRTYHNIYAILYSIVVMIIGYAGFMVEECLFIPFIAGVYLINNLFVILLLNTFLVFMIFGSNHLYDIPSLISIMALSIVFEIIAPFIIHERKYDHEVTEHIYEKIQSTNSSEMLNFALFLDKFAIGFQNPKEYNERLSDGIKSIVQNHCVTCPKEKECFNQYKTELYQIFKSLLDRDDKYKSLYPKFETYCPKIRSIEQTARLLEHTFSNIEQTSRTNNNTLIAQITGLSNTIKKYVLDVNSKIELSYYDLMSIKKVLVDYGYDITYFEIVKQYEDDFLITLGVKNKSFDEIKNTIRIISENIIKKDLSVVFYKEESNNIYINIIPKIKIDVTYGYGALSCEDIDICGDNYLVKEMKNGRFISAISDGMGKGYRAFYESDMTLKLVEDIIQLNISSDTALEILNTFYSVQDYLEQYATLDFLEINRYNSIAHFYKMGATTSYILKNDGRIDKIINKNLPFGIDDEVDMYKYKLEPGDLILMSSDGVFENIINVSEFEIFMEKIKNYPPQKIVYEILNYTINHNIQTKDDMSVIALKIQPAF